MARICPGCGVVHETEYPDVVGDLPWPFCPACVEVLKQEEIAAAMAEAEQAEEEAGAHADWEAQQAAEADADAWHSQYD